MKKTCVFINGTNGTGKSSLVREIIRACGGIDHTDEWNTYCTDGVTCFGGKYSKESKYGGIDGLNQTRCLDKVVGNGLKSCVVVICEGMNLDTFGLNLTNAMFLAERHLLVFLYAPVATIHQRLKDRSGKGITNKVISKQHNCARAAQKWQSIGVPVLAIDTSKISVEAEVKMILSEIKELCGE